MFFFWYVRLSETEGVSSGCEASGVREEIARDYAALQSRLRREFSDRQGKLHASKSTPTFDYVFLTLITSLKIVTRLLLFRSF